MIARLLMIVTLLLLAPLASAGEREQAELDRLAEEISKLSERQAWSAVERRYEQILALNGVEVPFDVHVTAAHAARAEGEMAVVLDRLERATALRETEETTAWMRDINENYGRVTLLTVPPRSVKLSPEAIPFDPAQRKAVEVATRKLKDDGEFEGMLPLGNYSLAGRDFEVLPGIGTTVELSAKELRAERKSRGEDDESSEAEE